MELLNKLENDTILISSLKDESVLLKQMAEGNKSAFNILYNYFQPKLYLYILPFIKKSEIGADEILQDIFVKMWMKRESFAGIISLEYYLYRMARNRLIDIKRSHRVVELQKVNYQQNTSMVDNQTEKELQFREFRKIVVKAIGNLTERRRKIFELSVDKDLSLTDIAVEMKISKDVVKKQLYQASRFVREYLQKHN